MGSLFFDLLLQFWRLFSEWTLILSICLFMVFFFFWNFVCGHLWVFDVLFMLIFRFLGLGFNFSFVLIEIWICLVKVFFFFHLFVFPSLLFGCQENLGNYWLFKYKNKLHGCLWKLMLCSYLVSSYGLVLWFQPNSWEWIASHIVHVLTFFMSTSSRSFK